MWTKRSGSASMKYDPSACRVLCQWPENMEAKKWLSPVRVLRVVTKWRSPMRRVMGPLPRLVVAVSGSGSDSGSDSGSIPGFEIGGGEGGMKTSLEKSQSLRLKR